MSGGPELRVEENALFWNPAVVSVPSPPALAPGDDPMSVMIAAIMPNIADDVIEKVASTRVREQRFADNLHAARYSYRRCDDDGRENIQAASEPLVTNGTVAPMPTSAGTRSADGGIGHFGQLMSITMQLAGAAGSVPAALTQGHQTIADQGSQLASMMGESLTGNGRAEWAPGTAELDSIRNEPSQSAEDADKNPAEEGFAAEEEIDRPNSKTISQSDSGNPAGSASEVSL